MYSKDYGCISESLDSGKKVTITLKAHNSPSWEDYYGFTLKQGHWYGREMSTGVPVVITGWEYGDYTYVYLRTSIGAWEGRWVETWQLRTNIVNKDDLPELEDHPLTFYKWLSNRGIKYHDFDSKYSSSSQDELYKEYEKYTLWKGLPECIYQMYRED